MIKGKRKFQNINIIIIIIKSSINPKFIYFISYLPGILPPSRGNKDIMDEIAVYRKGR